MTPSSAALLCSLCCIAVVGAPPVTPVLRGDKQPALDPPGVPTTIIGNAGGDMIDVRVAPGKLFEGDRSGQEGAPTDKDRAGGGKSRFTGRLVFGPRRGPIVPPHPVPPPPGIHIPMELRTSPATPIAEEDIALGRPSWHLKPANIVIADIQCEGLRLRAAVAKEGVGEAIETARRWIAKAQSLAPAQFASKSPAPGILGVNGGGAASKMSLRELVDAVETKILAGHGLLVKMAASAAECNKGPIAALTTDAAGSLRDGALLCGRVKERLAALVADALPLVTRLTPPSVEASMSLLQLGRPSDGGVKDKSRSTRRLRATASRAALHLPAPGTATSPSFSRGGGWARRTLLSDPKRDNNAGAIAVSDADAAVQRVVARLTKQPEPTPPSTAASPVDEAEIKAAADAAAVCEAALGKATVTASGAWMYYGGGDAPASDVMKRAVADATLAMARAQELRAERAKKELDEAAILAVEAAKGAAVPQVPDGNKTAQPCQEQVCRFTGATGPASAAEAGSPRPVTRREAQVKTRKAGCLQGCAGAIEGNTRSELAQVAPERGAEWDCPRYCASVGAKDATAKVGGFDTDAQLKGLWVGACVDGCNKGVGLRKQAGVPKAGKGVDCPTNLLTGKHELWCEHPDDAHVSGTVRKREHGGAWEA